MAQENWPQIISGLSATSNVIGQRAWPAEKMEMADRLRKIQSSVQHNDFDTAGKNMILLCSQFSGIARQIEGPYISLKGCEPIYGPRC